MPTTNNPRNRKYTEAAIARALELKLKGTSGPEISKLTGMSIPAVGAYTSPNGRLRPKAEAALRMLQAENAARNGAPPAEPRVAAEPKATRIPVSRPLTQMTLDEQAEEVARLREEVAYLRKAIAGYWAKEER